MKTLDRYLLRRVLVPMLTAIAVTLLALLAERALSVIDLVLGWRGSFLVVFEMLSYLIPHYMGLALPAAFFLGMLLAIGRLSRESEVDAMRAAGFGLDRIARSMLLLAFAVAVLHLVLVSHLQPYSRYAYRAALHTVTGASFQNLIQPGRFVTLGESTYRVEGLSKDRERFEGLFLYTEEADQGTVALTAKSGELVTGGGQGLTLKLEEGVQQLAPEEQVGPEGEGRALPPLTLRFGELVTNLSGTEPEPFRPRGENERELTLPELWARQGVSTEEVQAIEVAAELHGRIVRTLSILVLPFLAVPLSLPRQRAGRSYGFLIGIVALVGYNQVIKAGESLADNGEAHVALALWLPFGLFAAASLALFASAAYRVPGAKGRSFLDRWAEAVLAKLVAWSRTGRPA